MQSNVILYLPIKINVLWLHCIHMLPHPKAVQLLWLEKRKQASYWQCTIQEQSGSPQESHLISSSLHVINLPAQCYCSAGHFSSFRDRGIDQVRTVSIVHLCVCCEWKACTIPHFFLKLQQKRKTQMHSEISRWVGLFPHRRLMVWCR